MAAKNPISLERLRAVLDYDPDSGLFRWRHRAASHRAAGSVAGSRCNQYMRVRVDDITYYQHRLAWFYVNGEWPLEQVDHINGIKTDNRIENLRLASKSLNQENRRTGQARSRSGLIGAAWASKRSKWQAQIMIRGKYRFLGYFETALDAHLAYVNAKRLVHAGCTI